MNKKDIDVQVCLEQTIMAGIAGHARSHQRLIGPSGLGTNCLRKLCYLIAKADPGGLPHTQWRQTVGTAVHAWLEEAFSGSPDWITERRLEVGLLGGNVLKGTADLYHITSDTVIDFKVPGITGLKRLREKGMSQTYLVQLQLYGLGYENLEYRPKTVALCALPASGELRDLVYLEHPYDREVALKALERGRRMLARVESLGLDRALEGLPVSDEFCRRCDWARPAPGRPTCPTANPVVESSSLKDLLGRSKS